MPEQTTESPAAETPTEPAFPSWERDEKGLLKGVKYHYKANGRIDWRKMVDPQYLVVNKGWFESRKLTVPDKIDGLEDKQLLILLGGVRDLADIRGYINAVPNPIVSTPSFASCKTVFNWIPNYETSGVAQTSGGVANAHNNNTTSFVKVFLDQIAENRAFVRGVRNYLNIQVVGQDEIGPDGEVDDKDNSESQGSPQKFLQGFLNKKGISFEKFKNKMNQKGVEGADGWESISDVPAEKVHEIIDIVEQIIKEHAEKKAAEAKK